jgi:hypothetical protein
MSVELHYNTNGRQVRLIMKKYCTTMQMQSTSSLLSFPKIMSNEQTTSPHSPGAPLSLFLSVGSDLALPHVELEEPIISQLY